MPYNPQDYSPRPTRPGQPQRNQRPDDSQDFSYETAGYDAPPYDPSSYETQELWGDNRRYRQHEGYSDQSFRGNRDYRTTQEDFRAQQGYGRPYESHSFDDSGRGYARQQRNDQQSQRRPREWEYPQHSAQYAGLQQSPNYQSSHQAGNYDRFPQQYGNYGSDFGTAQRQYAGDEAIHERGRWGNNPYAARQSQTDWSNRYRQPHGSGAGWQNNPEASNGDVNFARDQYSRDRGSDFGTDSGYTGDYALHRSFGGIGNDDRSARQNYRGNAPKGYERSDERIREDICERLTHDPRVDASDITVAVKTGIVTLEGSVADRGQKYRIEDVADDVSGVKDVQNRLNVTRQSRSSPDQSRTFQDGDLGKGGKVTRQ